MLLVWKQVMESIPDPSSGWKSRRCVAVPSGCPALISGQLFGLHVFPSPSSSPTGVAPWKQTSTSVAQSIHLSNWLAEGGDSKHRHKCVKHLFKKKKWVKSLELTVTTCWYSRLALFIFPNSSLCCTYVGLPQLLPVQRLLNYQHQSAGELVFKCTSKSCTRPEEKGKSDNHTGSPISFWIPPLRVGHLTERSLHFQTKRDVTKALRSKVPFISADLAFRTSSIEE